MNNILLSNKEKVTFIKTNKGNFTATLTQTKTLTMKNLRFSYCKCKACF